MRHRKWFGDDSLCQADFKRGSLSLNPGQGCGNTRTDSRAIDLSEQEVCSPPFLCRSPRPLMHSFPLQPTCTYRNKPLCRSSEPFHRQLDSKGKPREVQTTDLNLLAVVSSPFALLSVTTHCLNFHAIRSPSLKAFLRVPKGCRASFISAPWDRC